MQFLGGEPTTHPEFTELVWHGLNAGLGVQVFSNLFRVCATWRSSPESYGPTPANSCTKPSTRSACRRYAAAVRGHRDALNVLRTSNRWSYFSPAEGIAPGERMGRFRIGGDQPVLDAEGRSRISMEDAAVAHVDEVELPRFVQHRFTIGY